MYSILLKLKGIVTFYTPFDSSLNSQHIEHSFKFVFVAINYFFRQIQTFIRISIPAIELIMNMYKLIMNMYNLQNLAFIIFAILQMQL